MSTSRQPEGIPVGGQWATGSKAESDIELEGSEPHYGDVGLKPHERETLAAMYVADRLSQAHPGVTRFTYRDDTNEHMTPQIGKILDADGTMFRNFDEDSDLGIAEAVSEMPDSKHVGHSWLSHHQDVGNGYWEVDVAELRSPERTYTPPVDPVTTTAQARDNFQSALRQEEALRRRTEVAAASFASKAIREHMPAAAQLSISWINEDQVYYGAGRLFDADGREIGHTHDRVFPEADRKLIGKAIEKLPEVHRSAEEWKSDPRSSWIRPTRGDYAVLDLTQF